MKLTAHTENFISLAKLPKKNTRLKNSPTLSCCRIDRFYVPNGETLVQVYSVNLYTTQFSAGCIKG